MPDFSYLANSIPPKIAETANDDVSGPAWSPHGPTRFLARVDAHLSHVQSANDRIDFLEAQYNAWTHQFAKAIMRREGDTDFDARFKGEIDAAEYRMTIDELGKRLARERESLKGSRLLLET